MAVCNFPQTSSPIGQASTSCLQRFTIHFRRPAKLKQNKNAPYKGEYGFDWLRDEYIYPMEVVLADMWSSTPRNLNMVTPLCKDPINLRKEYLPNVESPEKEFKPHGQDYYPAWLSIFACNVQVDNADAGSNMHEHGVYLDLQLEEIDEIINDNTEIFFKPSVPCLKITPEKISISEFLKTKREKQIIDNRDKQLKIYYYYYKLENAVKIICQGDTLKQHEEIKVFAKLGSNEYEVGQLMVYQNNEIGKANIIVVNVITEYDKNNNKVIPQSHPSLKNLYNFQSFNQAMIQANINTRENFDLFALKKKHHDVKKFFEDIDDPNYLDGTRPKMKKRRIDPAEDIRKRLCALYEKYGKYAPKGKRIKDGGHYNTYLLFTNLSPGGGALGIVQLNKKKFKGTYEWGNMFVIFANALTDDHTIVHEAAHSFTLPHIFEHHTNINNKPIFYQGYTENYMDYTWLYKDVYNDKDYSTNKYNGQMYSFFKWQWDLMRNDKKSIKFPKKQEE